MANQEHLEIIRKGVDEWNQWRKRDVTIRPDLSNANLSMVNLEEADLMGANLRGSNLSRSNLQRAKLIFANLTGADLTEAIVCGAELAKAKLSKTNFSSAHLMAIQALGCDFEDSILTGACIQYWNINAATKLDRTVCKYIFLTFLGGPKWHITQTEISYSPPEYGERRPGSGNFKPGEFAVLFQKALETVDLIFADGVDWKAFFFAFQELCDFYNDDHISLQAIEKKNGEAFVIRLEVSSNVDKLAIETQVKHIYEIQLKALEAQYEKQFRLQGAHLDDMKQAIEAERREKATLMGILATMAKNQQGSMYDMRGAQFDGGFAENVQGDQIGDALRINRVKPEEE